MNDKNNGNDVDDDRYVIEDTGDTVEDIEHEMEVAAQEAVDGPAVDGPAAPAAVPADDFRDRYLRTLADFENFRKRSEREKNDFQRYALAGSPMLAVR